MKPFVIRDRKAVVAVAAAYFLLIAVVDPLGTARLVGLLVLIFISGSALFRIVDRPPGWVRRSRLEPLLRRWRIEDEGVGPPGEVDPPRAVSGAARSRGSR